VSRRARIQRTCLARHVQLLQGNTSVIIIRLARYVADNRFELERASVQLCWRTSTTHQRIAHGDDALGYRRWYYY